MNDLKFACRQLLKNPGFTAVAVLTLALGIAATTSIVSIVRTALFDPLPTPHPDRLVQLGFLDKERGWREGINPAALREVQRQTNLFSRVAAYHWDALTLAGEDYPQPVRGSWVTPGFFGWCGQRPLLGRTFAADEGQPGRDGVIVISYQLWQRQYGGDPAMIGRSIPFRERPLTVVGVMPPHFSFPDAQSQYWRPADGPAAGTDEYLPNTQAIAELQPGTQQRRVQSFLDVVTQRQGQQFLQGKPSWFPFQVRELREMFSSREERRALGLLLGAIAFVLLIAAANIANLQLARTETRRQELAVRAALGAGRARVFRQLLTENLVLAAVGGGASLSLTGVGLELFEHLIPAALPRLKPIVLDWSVLGISSSVTLLTGLLFGLAPAWQGRRSDIGEVLKLGAATSTRDRRAGRFSRRLIVGQLALVLLLLAGAGLMVRSVFNLLHVNPDLDPRNVVRVYPSILGLMQRNFNPNPSLNRAPEAAFAFFAEARQRLAGIPGVVATGVGFEGPETEAADPRGLLPVRLQKYWIGTDEADPLRVLRVRLREGRWLDHADAAEGVHSVLVNEVAARMLWPGEMAVGQRFRAKERQREGLEYEVVGVVSDTRDYARRVEPQPTFYRALTREPDVELAPMFLVVRTLVAPATLYRPIGQALKAAGADSRMPEFLNMQETLQAAMAGHRAVMLYLSIFAGVGLMLSAIGLYGVLAYGVARRTREIGIRMALGAPAPSVVWMILTQGLSLVATGTALGTVLALAAGRLLRSYLFGITNTDPVTFLAVAVLMVAVALFASWLPARRAAQVDPMEALRTE